MTNSRRIGVVALLMAGALVAGAGDSETNAAASQTGSPAATAPAGGESAAPAPAEEMIGLSEEEAGYEWVVAFDYVIPSDDAMWGTAEGVDAAVCKWFKRGLGAALTVSASKWDLASEPEVPQDISGRHDPEVKGSADVIAPGAEVLYRIPVGERFRLLLDAGLRYAFVDSSIEMTYSYREHFGNRIHVVSSVSIEDRLQGTLGATVAGRWKKESRWGLFAGVGYVFDISASDENWLYENVANDLGALVVRAGLSF